MEHLFAFKAGAVFRICSKGLWVALEACEVCLDFSCVELNDEFVAAVKLWLRENFPEFAGFQIAASGIAASGKYLGWTLGVDSAIISYHDPLAKFNKRVLEIADGKAPSTVAFLRYNERAVSVLSYVAQFGTLLLTLASWSTELSITC